MKIIDNFRIDDATGCWNWTGRKNTDGYPVFRYQGRDSRGNRVIANLYLGLDINDRDSHALHICDNPGCINPKHIFIGTHDQNMKDMAAKGRGGSGYRGIRYCKRGHEFTPENTRFEKERANFKPGRRCKACHRDCERARRAAAKIR